MQPASCILCNELSWLLKELATGWVICDVMNDYVVRVHIGGTKVRVNFILADQLAEIRTQSNMSGMLALHLLNHRAATSLAFSLILNFIFSIFLSECKRN